MDDYSFVTMEKGSLYCLFLHGVTLADFVAKFCKKCHGYT